MTLTYKSDLNIAKMIKVDITMPYVPSRRLHSSDRNLLHKDRTNLVMANRAFFQSVWSSLPQNVISDLSNLATFKRLLKFELYDRAFHH